MPTQKVLTATIAGTPTNMLVEAYDESTPWDGPCIEPILRPTPPTSDPTWEGSLVWEDVWVGPGWTTEPSDPSRLFATWESMKSGIAGLGITASDNLRIWGFSGAANKWNFGGVLDPDVGQQGTVVLGNFRPGPGWTLLQPSRVAELPTPDANVKGVVANLGSRIDPTAGERAKLLHIDRPVDQSHNFIISLDAKNWVIRGIEFMYRGGDNHPYAYQVQSPGDPPISRIPTQIHFVQCLGDGGGIDADWSNPNPNKGIAFGMKVNAAMSSVTDSYLCGYQANYTETKALWHGAGMGFLARNLFLQGSGPLGGPGFQHTSDRESRAGDSSWEWIHGHKEITSVNGPTISKGGLEAKGVDGWLVEGFVGENITVGANATSSDPSNSQLVGCKGFTNTLGVTGKSTNFIARFCVGIGYLKAFYLQAIGASGGFTSWGIQRASVHDFLMINHGGEAGNAAADQTVYEQSANMGTWSFQDDPAGRRTPTKYEVRGITIVNNSPGTVPPPGGGEPMKHMAYLGDAPAGYGSVDCAMTDIIGPPTWWGFWGSPSGNSALDPGGTMENTDSRYIAGGINTHAGDDWFQHGDMGSFLDANGMLNAAGKTAWRAQAGLGPTDPICTQVPRRHPNGTTFTPAADQPGAAADQILALLGGTLSNPGTNIKSTTILYP